MPARRQIVLGLVDALEPIVAAIGELTAQIRQAVDDHPDGATFRSLFIGPDSVLRAATMIAEIGDCRDRYPSCRQLAADGGQAPVAVESRKAKRAQFRWACDHRLREAFNVLADSSRRHNPWAATSMTAPEPAAPATNTPPASSAAPGAPRLGPDHLAALARPRHLRPEPPHRTTTTRCHSGLTPSSVHPDRPHRHPATARRRRHLRLPARAERAALDGKPTDATPTPELTQGV